MYICYYLKFKILASFCSWAGWFESYLVEYLRRHVFVWRGSLYKLDKFCTSFLQPISGRLSKKTLTLQIRSRGGWGTWSAFGFRFRLLCILLKKQMIRYLKNCVFKVSRYKIEFSKISENCDFLLFKPFSLKMFSFPLQVVYWEPFLNGWCLAK